MPGPSHGQASAVSQPAPPPPTLATAIRNAVHLGPAGETTTVSLSFGLKVRDPARLARLIASGQTVSPESYTAQFGPAPAATRAAVGWLHALGFNTRWAAGSGLIAADGPAPRAAQLLQVDIESYRLADGTSFYAALGEPRMPPQLASAASSVSGLDNYRGARVLAVRRGGLTPTDVLAFYNLKPLRDAGIDGP